MTRFALISVCIVAFVGACKKKEENKGSQPGTVASAPGTPNAANEPTGSGRPDPAEGLAGPGTNTGGSAVAPAGGTAGPAKAEYKPDEIWKDTAGVARMDLMEKFKDGATVTGTVKAVKDDPAGEYVLVFDAGDGKSVEAMLADPKPARDKKVKAGDTVTVTKCQVANPTDTSLPLRTCDLK